MVDIDLPEFLLTLARLCAGFDVPMTEARKDAYWQAFRKLPLRDFERLVNSALSADFEKIPTTASLWRLHRKNAAPTPVTVQEGPTLQEQLCAYATLQLSGRLKPLELSMPWTYVYREWTDEARKTPFNKDGKCAECTGVVIDLQDGTRLGFSVAAMQADIEGHAKALRSFKPGPKPSDAQTAAWRSKLPDMRL